MHSVHWENAGKRLRSFLLTLRVSRHSATTLRSIAEVQHPTMVLFNLRLPIAAIGSLYDAIYLVQARVRFDRITWEAFSMMVPKKVGDVCHSRWQLHGSTSNVRLQPNRNVTYGIHAVHAMDLYQHTETATILKIRRTSPTKLQPVASKGCTVLILDDNTEFGTTTVELCRWCSFSYAASCAIMVSARLDMKAVSKASSLVRATVIHGVLVDHHPYNLSYQIDTG